MRLERGVGEYVAHRVLDVVVFREVGVAAGFLDGGGDFVEKFLEACVAVMAGMAGALDRAAMGVPEDEDEWRV